MSNLATGGYGLRPKIRKSGPASYGMDGALAILYFMLGDSSQGSLQAASREISLETLSLKRDPIGASLESDRVGSSSDGGRQGFSYSKDAMSETVNPDIEASSTDSRMHRETTIEDSYSISLENDLDKETIEKAVRDDG